MSFNSHFIFLTMTAVLATCCLGEQFQNIKFNQDISTDSIETVKASMKRDQSIQGIVIKSDSEVRIYTEEANGIDGIFINDMCLKDIVNEMVVNGMRKVRDSSQKTVSDSIKHSENPLWGKKLTIVGDSEVEGSWSYGSLIGERNGMQVVNSAVGGLSLVQYQDNDSLYSKYQDWIPQDADYIIVHIGYNDATWSWNSQVSDDSTDTTTFKGCWNLFLNALKTNYPDAKKAIVLPYYWNTENDRQNLVQWMKARCDVYQLEYIDGTQELGFNPQNQPQYFGTDGGSTSKVHFSNLGHKRASYLYENFLKTRVQFSK